jgi:hypothetical protein
MLATIGSIDGEAGRYKRFDQAGVAPDMFAHSVCNPERAAAGARLSQWVHRTRRPSLLVNLTRLYCSCRPRSAFPQHNDADPIPGWASHTSRR